jgi:hypothetical protein
VVAALSIVAALIGLARAVFDHGIRRWASPIRAVERKPGSTSEPGPRVVRAAVTPQSGVRLRLWRQRLHRGPATGGIQSYLLAALPILGIGLFCGLWARNTGRDFWLWFVAGLVFSFSL